VINVGGAPRVRNSFARHRARIQPQRRQDLDDGPFRGARVRGAWRRRPGGRRLHAEHREPVAGSQVAAKVSQLVGKSYVGSQSGLPSVVSVK